MLSHRLVGNRRASDDQWILPAGRVEVNLLAGGNDRAPPDVFLENPAPLLENTTRLLENPTR